MRGAAGTRALLLACAAALLARALARRSCNTARYGLQRGREVHIQDQRMAPSTSDWKIQIPPVCERIVGVMATACDADGAPSVYMSSLTSGLVIRGGDVSTGAYLYVTVFCDPSETNPELLEIFTTHTPSMLRLPSVRAHKAPSKLPWLMGSKPMVPISPDKLIVLSSPRWPKAHASLWPQQPVVLGVKSFTIPASSPLLYSKHRTPSAKPFEQTRRPPLRHPNLGSPALLSRSPTTEYPGARWAGQNLHPHPKPKPEPELASAPDENHEQETPLNDEPAHVQKEEEATVSTASPDLDQGNASLSNDEPHHDDSHDENLETPPGDQLQHDINPGQESGQNGLGVIPMSGPLGQEDDVNATSSEQHHQWPMRPLTLVRKIAQWWKKHLHGGLRHRRMPWRRGHRLSMLGPGALWPGARRTGSPWTHPLRVRPLKPDAWRSDVLSPNMLEYGVRRSHMPRVSALNSDARRSGVPSSDVQPFDARIRPFSYFRF